jgi:hypothetical protein
LQQHCKTNKKYASFRKVTEIVNKQSEQKNATAETVIREKKTHYNLSDFISLSEH